MSGPASSSSRVLNRNYLFKRGEECCFCVSEGAGVMAVVSQLSVSLGGGGSVGVDKVSDETDLKKYAKHKCTLFDREDQQDPFVVVDIGRLFGLHARWKAALPNICPFYAVKCNDDKLLLKTLAAIGTGFDCASKNEIEAMLDLGVAPSRIIYANPCKQISHLLYAAEKGVELMTFDNEWELHKVKKHYPSAKLVLRIRADDPNAICQLGIKYGCSVPVGKVLLHTALSLDLNVVGVSFHVGSGCQTPLAYQSALQLSSELFQYAAGIGCHFTLLDIGGGFPGDTGSDALFNDVTNSINKGLATYFSPEQFPNVEIIAEPGRYFACSTHAIAVNVISKRLHTEERGRDFSYMYYVNDGVYGSFNCVLYDHNIPTPSVLKGVPTFPPHYKTSLWGPTCDGLDKICEAFMPELDIGDWIYFDNMGAYTISAYSAFNGFAKPVSYYFVKESDSVTFESVVPVSPGVPVSPHTGMTRTSATPSEEYEPVVPVSPVSTLGAVSGHVTATLPQDQLLGAQQLQEPVAVY